LSETPELFFDNVEHLKKFHEECGMMHGWWFHFCNSAIENILEIFRHNKEK
jgi:hypothetical protein